MRKGMDWRKREGEKDRKREKEKELAAKMWGKSVSDARCALPEMWLPQRRSNQFVLTNLTNPSCYNYCLGPLGLVSISSPRSQNLPVLMLPYLCAPIRRGA